jgi:hypothetical protein
MRSILQKLVLGVAITVTGAFAADNSLGTWKLNLEKSKFSPSAPVKSLTATREATDEGVKVTTTGSGLMVRRLMAAKQRSMTAKNIPLLEPHTTASPLER